MVHSDNPHKEEHHDNHEHHTTELDIDYSHFDERFNNRPVPLSESPTSIDALQLNYIRDNALNWTKPIDFPLNLTGLELMRTSKTPSTRKWYRRVSSFERNGFLNVWTMKLTVKLRYWLFYPVVLWGITNHVFQGMYFDEYDFDEDNDSKVYDKLSSRALPFARVWSRPG